MSNFGDGISWENHIQQVIDDSKRGIAIFHSDNKTVINEAVTYIKTDTDPLNRKAVDCGCHMGRWIDVITRLGLEYTGVDQSSQAIAFAKQNRPNAKFHNSFLWEMPFENEFDFAMCNAVLQHNTISEQEKIVPKIFNALKRGGVFFFAESTLRVNTATQRTQDGWINLGKSCGFEFVKFLHKNELGLEDMYIFRKP